MNIKNKTKPKEWIWPVRWWMMIFAFFRKQNKWSKESQIIESGKLQSHFYNSNTIIQWLVAKFLCANLRKSKNTTERVKERNTQAHSEQKLNLMRINANPWSEGNYWLRREKKREQQTNSPCLKLRHHYLSSFISKKAKKNRKHRFVFMCSSLFLFAMYIVWCWLLYDVTVLYEGDCFIIRKLSQ